MSSSSSSSSIPQSDNVLFKKLRSLISLIDSLRDCGVQEYIRLPRICVLGTQSAGKSSVLEAIVGLDFLPRGDGVVTRRPLEMRLNNISSGTPWAVFEEVKGEKFTDFNKVRETIEKLTDDVCKDEKNIVDKPIILNVFSPTCPDLTLVDLPGITRVPVGKQPKNIEEITKNMALRYVKDPLTLILCVAAANADLATSDGIKMAKEIDVKGVRTLGVLTKLDIMDAGTDAGKVLMNKEIPLKLGYVGVKCRSKQELMSNLPMSAALAAEKKFFQEHKVYKHLPGSVLGCRTLVEKLTKVMFRIIRENLPGIVRNINDSLRHCESELSSLGTPMPTDEGGKIAMMWRMLCDYCDTFRDILQGKCLGKKDYTLKDEGGYKIQALFKGLLKEYTGDYKATKSYSDEDINYQLNLHSGDSIPGFPSVDAFYYLLKPKLEQLREPINECTHNIFSYLEILSSKILERTFGKFPKVISGVSAIVNPFFLSIKENAEKLVSSIVDMDINYLFTNDFGYMSENSSFISRRRKESQTDPTAGGKSIFIKEIRARIESYFGLIVKNLRNAIPKALEYTLVREIENNMKMKLYDSLINEKKVLQALNEPEGLARQRIELTRQIKVMKNAQKLIKKDPDLMNVMQINIDEADIKAYEENMF